MSDTQAANSVVDDIVDDIDSAASRLSRKADSLLERETRSFDHKVESVRDAIREDVEHGRDWARERAEMTRSAIQEEPLKATLYAVGVGVLIGLLLRR